MAYDIGKDKQHFLGSVRDFGHQRLAKQMVDAKRQAKAAPPAAAMEDAEGAEMAGAEMEGDLAAEGGELLAEAGAEDAPEGGELIPVEVSPEELEILQKLRAARG